MGPARRGGAGHRAAAARPDGHGPPSTAAARETVTLDHLSGALWSGGRVSFQGEHYRVDEVTFLPTPVQRPRIPVLVAGVWPRRAPLRRAARFDGVVPLKVGQDELVTLDPGELAELLAVVRAERPGGGPFEAMVAGRTPGDDPAAARAVVEPLAEAGMTWWTEGLEPRRGDLRAMRERIRQGPPRP